MSEDWVSFRDRVQIAYFVAASVEDPGSGEKISGSWHLLGKDKKVYNKGGAYVLSERLVEPVDIPPAGIW